MHIISFPKATTAISVVKYNKCVCSLIDIRPFTVKNIDLMDLAYLKSFFKIGVFVVCGEYRLDELVNALYLCSKDAGIIKDECIVSVNEQNCCLTKYNDVIVVNSTKELHSSNNGLFSKQINDIRESLGSRVN